MGERDLFDEDDGVGPASCCPELLPKKEVSIEQWIDNRVRN